MEFGPGDFSIIPPGHDAWIVGDEPDPQLERSLRSCDHTLTRFARGETHRRAETPASITCAPMTISRRVALAVLALPVGAVRRPRARAGVARLPHLRREVPPVRRGDRAQ